MWTHTTSLGVSDEVAGIGHSVSEQGKRGIVMSLIDAIREKIVLRNYEFSRHAVDQTLVRRIRVGEFEEAFRDRSEVIEDYPDDKYGPSCLVLGFTSSGRPLHVQCSYPTRSLVKIITLYEPDPSLWIDHRLRRNVQE